MGGYYQDIRPALPLVEGGYHGELDEDGVPAFRRAGKRHYHATTIAQYALALHDVSIRCGSGHESALLEGKFRTQLSALEMRIEAGGPWRGFAVSAWDNEKYPQLRAGWVSAMCQGNMVSALLRGWQRFGDERWRGLAEMAFRALEKPLHEGGACVRETRGDVEDYWLEEYPMQPPSHVLNGFIYSLWGVLDWARATGDPTAWKWWQEGVDTLTRRLPEYDGGYWSVYDLRFRELVSRYYQENIHVPQMQAMFALTGVPVFDAYARRWQAQSESLLCRLRWAVMLRVNARLRRRK